MAGICNYLRFWGSVLAVCLSLSIPCSAQEIVIGDSIAVGLKQAGHLPGGAVTGASPAAVLHMLQTYPESFRARVVILSCGASNNPMQLPLCVQQLQLLHDAGASVVLMGVGNGLPQSEEINQLLDAYCEHFSGNFFVYGWEGIHPGDYVEMLNFIRWKECAWMHICSV